MDAEDIVHNAYAKAIRHIDKWDGSYTIEAWFGKILINCEKSFIRDEKRQGMSYDKKVSLYEEDEDGEPIINVMAEIVEDSVDITEIQDMQSLYRYIHRQPNKNKDVLLLYFVYQYSLSEIASLLDLDYKVCDNKVKHFKTMAVRDLGG